MMILKKWLFIQRWVYFNFQIRKIINFTFYQEEIINRNCRFLQGTHTDKSTVKLIRDAVINRKAIEVEILNYRKDGVAFWNNFLMLPVFKGKKCRYFIAIQKNVTVLKKDNSPDKWRPEELAMWLEFHGLPSFSQLIINLYFFRFESL